MILTLYTTLLQVTLRYYGYLYSDLQFRYWAVSGRWIQ